MALLSTRRPPILNAAATPLAARQQVLLTAATNLDGAARAQAS
jgi:hypothetical protein